jgi:hypothetical protein
MVADAMGEVCMTKRLLRAYQEATLAHSDAVFGLFNPMRPDFDLLFEAAERAHEEAVSARDALKQHIAEHGC